MKNEEMKNKMIGHIRRLLIEENILDKDNANLISGAIDAYIVLGVYLLPVDEKGYGWVWIDEIDMDTLEVICKYPVNPTKKEVLSMVLDREITKEQKELIKEDWRGFYDNPQKYRNLANVINEYLDDIDITDMSELIEH